MGKMLALSLCAFLTAFAAFADITNLTPQIQAVYGGSIRDIDIIETPGTTNQIRLFVSTEFSANSVFYADLTHGGTNMFATNSFQFRVVPDFDAQANHGTVNSIAVHEQSGRLFVAGNMELLSCSTAAGSLVTNLPSAPAFALDPPPPPGAQFLEVRVFDSVLVALATAGGSNELYFGSLDSAGKFTHGSGSPVPVGMSGVNAAGLEINPSNGCVYILDSAGTNGIRKSSVPCAALSGATVFSAIALPAAAASWNGNRQFGFGPEGRLFLGGSSATNYKVVAYSDNDGSDWTVVETGIGGIAGNNIRASYQTNNYSVLFGGAVSTNMGEAGSWKYMGWGGGPGQTHANDGSGAFDPLAPGVLFCASDQGIAASVNNGMTLNEIDYGLEAVAIQDLDMNAAKTLAWTASKSGLRRGAGAPMALDWTPDGIFPTGDGSPYYSIAIDQADLSGNTVYAGNGNIYKSTDGGTNWSRVWALESNTNGFPNNGFYSALTADGTLAAAGFFSWNGQGGLLVSQDSGLNWAQAMSDIDVNDFVAGTNSILVAAAYNASTGAGGIYNVSPSGTVREMSESVSVRCLAPDSAGGVYACGQDASYGIKIYYKLIADTSWTAVSTNGLPAQNQMISGRGPVMTVGKDSASNDLPVIVIGNSLYYLKSGDTSWRTSAALMYPAGSTINVLYWDELMVGTTEGLYSQAIVTEDETVASIPLAADFDGDGKADPAVFNTNGTWKIKLSSGNYALVTLSGFLGGSGADALAADFDGDGKADPAVYYAAQELWTVKLSMLNYLAPTVLTSFGGAGWQAVAGDFDGDAKADPALYNTNGTWQVKLSTAGYATIPVAGLLGFAGWQALAADFDGDGKVDPAIYRAETGSWIVLLSKANYALAVLEPGFMGSSGYTGMAADFDGDRFADPAVSEANTGNWKLKLSSGNYSLVDLPNFLVE